MSRTITRREFIKITAAAGASLTLDLGCSNNEPSGPTFDEIPQGRVVLVRAETAQTAVARGVRRMGRFSFIQPGQKVMLKPNMTGPLLPPDTTSPEVLCELIRQCYAAGAGEVIVAERTFADMETLGVFDFMLYDGSKSMLEFVETEGATFRPLDDEPWVEVSPSGAVDFHEPILVPSILDEVDHVINVPALKTHNIAVFTMSMKNLFGLVHPDTRYGQVHGHPLNDGDPDRQLRMFAQMNLAFHPAVNVMDAWVSRTTGGPTPPGDVAHTKMVLLGKDRVAVDAVGLAVLKAYGTEPHIEDRPIWDQVQLAEAVRVGVGVSDPEQIELEGDGVDEIDEIASFLR